MYDRRIFQMPNRGLGSATPRPAGLDQAISELIAEYAKGIEPVIGPGQTAAFKRAVMDEVGRGTDPGSLRDRLLACIAGESRDLRNAA